MPSRGSRRGRRKQRLRNLAETPQGNEASRTIVMSAGPAGGFRTRSKQRTPGFNAEVAEGGDNQAAEDSQLVFMGCGGH